MRNLKRALSLAMASIMLLGMMVVGASAKGLDDFGDAAEIVNQDAAAVTTAIGVFAGYDDGEFKPENIVTRAEMAVILCKMLYGADVKVEQFAETKVFTDVPAWAEGYVNLCASLGIVAGVGDNKYDPNRAVTTVEAAMMLTKTLGYFQNAKDFGDNWKLAATAKATSLGLYGDLKLSADTGLTRDSVAEMVFNALTKAVPVQYNELLGVYYNENKGILYSLTYYYTDTLGYKNFDLVYRTGENTDYGRPGTTWGIGSYSVTGITSGSGNSAANALNEDGSLDPDLVKMSASDEIITIADTPTYVYTSGTKQNVIYKAVGKSVIADYDWEAYVDGDEDTTPSVPANDKDVDYEYTAKGATTEIYVDDVNEEVTVVEINYYLAEVTRVREDDDGEYAQVRILSTTAPAGVDKKIYAEGFTEGDYVIITIDENDDGDQFVATIADPTLVDDTVKRVRKDEDASGNEGSSLVMADGTKYNYSSHTVSDVDDINEKHPTLDTEYRLFLDPNGYVVGFQALENVSKNYLYVDSIHVALGDIEAKVIFSDGTSAKVEIDDDIIDDGDYAAAPYGIVDEDDLVGKVFAWTEDDGVYTVRPVPEFDSITDTDRKTNFDRYKDWTLSALDGDEKINNEAAYIKANGVAYIVDEDTAFVDVNDKVLYTGFDAVPDYSNASFIAVDVTGDGVLEIVFITEGDAENSDDTYFYVADADDFDTDTKNKNYATHVVYVDGEKTELVFTNAGHNAVYTEGLYVVDTLDSAGRVKSCHKIGDNAGDPTFKSVSTVGTRSFYLTDGGSYAPVQYVVDADTVIVTVNITSRFKSNGTVKTSYDVDPGDLKDMKLYEDIVTLAYAQANGGIYDVKVNVVDSSNSNKTADLVFIEIYEWED